jgi:hypothetical protein
MDQQLTAVSAEAISALWKDPAIQEVYNFKHEYQVTEAIALFVFIFKPIHFVFTNPKRHLYFPPQLYQID